MAKVEIEASLMSSWREDSEPFRPTKTTTNSLDLTSSLDTYTVDILGFAGSVYNQYLSEKSTLPYRTVTGHFLVRLENVTHPTPAKGVVILPKGFREFQLTDLEFTSVQDISSKLTAVVDDLRSRAKY